MKLGWALLCSFLAVPLSAQEGVGQIAFANSGAQAAQEAFLRGLALLHNFEYSDAATSFKAAEQIDPSFVMAYWGEAMTYTHPVWMQQDLAAARAALARLATTPELRAAKSATARELGYLRTVEILYGEGKKEERDFRYADAMAALHAQYPDDVDATAFYALSLLGTAHAGRDTAVYMRAAALLEEVFPTHPQHPGVLHYLIHCYDDPIHAPLGMRAARRYGAVAPDAAHALHMTSHIFVALGMWDEVVAANVRAIDVVNRHRAAAGKPATHCGHYADWLNYAYLQLGSIEQARKVVTECRQQARVDEKRSGTPTEEQSAQVDSWASMRTFYLLDGGKRDEPSAPISADSLARPAYTLAYADALVAAMDGDLITLRKRAATLRQQQATVNAWIAAQPGSGASEKARPRLMQQQVEALVLIREGKRDSGLALLRKTAEEETALPMEFGPPFLEKPSWELLGDELLSSGRAADAAFAYQTELQRAPGRTASMRGLTRARNAVRPSAELAQQHDAAAAPHVHRH